MGGGRLGPDLRDAGLNYTRGHIREALFRPHEKVAKRYRMIRVSDQDGKQFEGVLMNEDGYTLHMMDRQENVHSFLKPDLKRIERPSRSLMPATKKFSPCKSWIICSPICAAWTASRASGNSGP